jgi:predicted amino acid-binding ACT domain protein
MKLKITKVDIWAAKIADRPGGLAKKLAALAAARANLQFVLARRTPESRGRAVVFVWPVRSAKQKRAARRAGFAKARGLAGVRVEGADRPGIGAKMTKALAAAGINLRGLSGAAIGKRFVAYVAADTAKDATKAAAVLRKLR